MERVNGMFPSGPIVIRNRMKVGTGEWTCFEGQNNFGLRAPDDQKSWVGVYHYIEKFVEETFYFGFQMTGANADKEVVGRFLDQDSEDRFAFGQAYSKVNNEEEDNAGEANFIASPAVGVSVTGGIVLLPPGVTSSIVIASSRRLETGIHRVICRFFCQGGLAKGDSTNLGSIGILRTNQEGNAWAELPDGADVTHGDDARVNINLPSGSEEIVCGLQYDTNERKMTIKWSKPTRLGPTVCTIDCTEGDHLFIAVELSASAYEGVSHRLSRVANTLVSIRNFDCSALEWTRF